MRLVAMSLLLFVFGACLLVPQITDIRLPEVIGLYAPVILILLSLLMQFEAVLFFKRISTLRKDLRNVDQDKHKILAELEAKAEVQEKLQLESAQREAELTTKLNAQSLASSRLQKAERAVQQLQEHVQGLQQELSSAQQNQGAEEQVLYLLASLQNKGRFLDFVMEEMTSYSDAEIGRAARIVHDGCRESLNELFEIAPLASAAEGESYEVGPQQDALRLRVLGNPPQDATVQGRLVHRGWGTRSFKLPQIREARKHESISVISPVEVEV